MTGSFESSYQIGAVIGFWINYGVTKNIATTSSEAWVLPSKFPGENYFLTLLTDTSSGRAIAASRSPSAGHSIHS